VEELDNLQKLAANFLLAPAVVNSIENTFLIDLFGPSRTFAIFEKNNLFFDTQGR
jgi:hypothetical protein